jgi:hypothetical protein
MSRRIIARERNERGLQLFFQSLKGVINLFLSPQDIEWTDELVEQTCSRLEEAYKTLTLMEREMTYVEEETIDRDNAGFHLLLDSVKSLHSYAKSFESAGNSTDSYAAQYVRHADGRPAPGRPKLNVTQEQIEFLRSLHFSWEKIAQLLQVSIPTLQRRRREFRINDSLEYSDISDENLDEIHRDLTARDANSSSSGGFLTPNIGRRRFIGALRSRGIRVQRWRVTQCLRRVDPVGTALRWRLVIHRRKYNVPTPNSLWHFDSAHKLIRWKLIVHVCIDGFSRLLIYCNCCDNNKAETVLELFKNGTQRYGVPSRARCDYGLENLFVGQYMLEQRGPNRGSIITGSSVHNCRVERTHRDVYAGVLCFYAQLFTNLERSAILDPLDELHLYCLHYIYLPRINRSLEEFVAQMNNRPISTEHNQSPVQLWTAGMLQNINSNHTALTEAELDLYGFDSEAESLIHVNDEDYQIQLTPPTYELTEALRLQLPDPMEDDGQQGQLSYMRCVELISSSQQWTY